jgi:hypothetical protein
MATAAAATPILPSRDPGMTPAFPRNLNAHESIAA